MNRSDDDRFADFVEILQTRCNLTHATARDAREHARQANQFFAELGIDKEFACQRQGKTTVFVMLFNK